MQRSDGLVDRERSLSQVNVDRRHVRSEPFDSTMILHTVRHVRPHDEFELRPLDQVEAVGDGRWRSKEGPVRLVLHPRDGGYVRGWALIRTQLRRRGADFSARLFVDCGGGPEDAEAVAIPVTRKGYVLELVWFAKHVHRLVWQPLSSPGEVIHGPLTITEVGPLERTWRMLRRVVPIFFEQPAARRKRVGLTLRRMIFSLPEAYRIAGQFRAYSPSLTYAEWITRFDALSNADRGAIRGHIERFGSYPRFHVLVTAIEADRGPIDATLQSLDAQIYRNFTATVLDAAGAVAPGYDPDIALREVGIGSRVVPACRIRTVLGEIADNLEGRSPAQFVVIVRAGTRLAEHALYWFASAIVISPGAALFYSDDDTIDGEGQRGVPRFKPDWSPEHLRSTDYVGSAVACRAEDLIRAGGLDYESCFGDGHGALLRMAEVLAPDAVRHIPAVLFHHPTRGVEGDGKRDEARARALATHLAGCGVVAKVSATRPDCYCVRYALPDSPPLVSIVVPTRDAVDLLRQCVESVAARSTYPRYEILVVDNGSAEPQALAYLAEIAGRPWVRVLCYDRPFNFSAINNFAATHAQGEVLCLMNNDTEVISPDWLEEMVGRLIQPGVGVVGAKLYYPDGRVQHAGDAVGPGGCADHMHSGLSGHAPGYCNRAIVAQEVSAVTAACLITWRSLYQELGGLNERDLPVSFNDVDFCLRVWEAGRRVLFTPHAELYHHESATRGADESREKQARSKREADYMRARWKARMRHDPYYNPNLSYLRPDFSLSNAPMVRRPWLVER